MAKGRKEDFSFRDLTGGLVMIVDRKSVEVAEHSFEREEFDNAVLTYGYIDHQAGIIFEFIR